MRWGIRKQCAREEGEGGGESERRGRSNGKAALLLFSPLSWLAKLTGKDRSKRAPAAASTAAHACLPQRASLATTPPAPHRATADVVPRRLSVGNDSAEAAGAARRLCHARRRRHCSLGGDRDLPPLGHLIPFSLVGGSSRAEPPLGGPSATPSDTDAAGARVRLHRRRGRRSLRGGNGNGRRSFTERMPVRVRVRAAAAGPELERLAVVRRTRDPQRAFRESMVEMIASSSGSRPEELERLLACYLALNADEHHGCIVKVFRQVWFEHINLLLPRPESTITRRRRLAGHLVDHDCTAVRAVRTR